MVLMNFNVQSKIVCTNWEKRSLKSQAFYCQWSYDVIFTLVGTATVALAMFTTVLADNAD